MCSKRKEDLSRNKEQNDQFGSWMKADTRKKEWVGSKVSNLRKKMREQEGNTIGYIQWRSHKKLGGGAASLCVGVRTEGATGG